MVEPNITSAIAASAARAITSIAVQASVPAWKRATELAVFEARKVRRLKEWPEISRQRAELRRLESFLHGRLCVGLLEAYAISYTSSTLEPVDDASIKSIFSTELARALKVKDGARVEYADDLWQRLTTTLRVSLDDLRKGDAFDVANLVLVAQLTQIRNDMSVLGSSVTRRGEVAASSQRSAQALDLVSRVRQASSDYFSEMLMPHARQGYRVSSGALYVTRSLTQLPLDWNVIKISENSSESTLSDIPEDAILDRRFVIIGNPGAGKSTFVRQLLHSIARDDKSELAPLFLELKSWTEDSGAIADMLADRLAATVQETTTGSVVEDVLTLGMGFVVLDGFDEVVDISRRRSLAQAIEAFARRYPLSRIAVSSRREGYEVVPLDSILFPAYRVPDFTDSEMEQYVTKWFDVVMRHDCVDTANMRSGFLRDSVHAAELRRNPLMLSLLCLLYQYDGYIPQNRLQVYEECAELLFGRWDRIRKVDTLVKGNIRGHHLVEEIAFHIFSQRGGGTGEREPVLRALVKDYLLQNLTDDEFDARAQADRFLQHCTGRAWLLTYIGPSVKGDRLFDFSHRTFMEYFSACRIARFATSPASLVGTVRNLIAHGSSTVIAQLAIERFGERVANGVDDALRLLVFDSASLEHHYKRGALEFAANAIQFLQPKPRTIQSILKTVLREYLVYCERHQSVDIGTVINLSPAAGNALREFASTLIKRKRKPENWLDEEATNGARLLLSRENTRGKDPRWLFRNAREMLVSEVVAGNISLHRYRSVAGKSCLVDVGLGYGDIKRISGPLVRQLQNAVKSGIVTDRMDEMFRLFVSDPDSLVPMSRHAIIEVIEEIMTLRDWTLVDVFGARRPVGQQPIVGIGNLCAAVAMEGYLHGLRDCVESATIIGFGVEFRLDIDARRSDLGEIVVGSSSVAINDRWKAYFEEWLSGPDIVLNELVLE